MAGHGDRDGGFDGPVTIAVTADYLDIFETRALHPEPSSSTLDADYSVTAAVLAVGVFALRTVALS